MGSPPARVYLSLPLTGSTGQAGRDVLRGAELALERSGSSVDLVALDANGPDRDARASANARRAAGDESALAYLGDFHSSQVHATAPMLSAAGLLQVAPAATFTGLGGATLVRIMPNDAALARAIADWLVRDARVQRLLVVHDDDLGYGAPVAGMCVEAARERGIHVRDRPLWDHGDPYVDDISGVEALLYVGVPGPGTAQLWRDLHAAEPGLLLLGTDGIAVDWLARALDAGAARMTRLFTAQRAAWGFYGFEAMALILDAVSAGADRPGIVRAARATRDRESFLGRYSIDDEGLTTSPASGRLAVVDGELVWDRQGLAV